MSTDRDFGVVIGHIKSSDYEAWARLNRVEIEPAELLVLKALDRAFVSRHNDRDADRSVVSSQPMTLVLFDSLFG